MRHSDPWVAHQNNPNAPPGGQYYQSNQQQSVRNYQTYENNTGRHQGTVRQLNSQYQGTNQTNRQRSLNNQGSVVGISPSQNPNGMYGQEGGHLNQAPPPYYYDQAFTGMSGYPQPLQSASGLGPNAGMISSHPMHHHSDMSDFERQSGRSRGYFMYSSRMDMLHPNPQYLNGPINDDQSSNQSANRGGWFNRSRRGRDLTVAMRSANPRNTNTFWTTNQYSQSDQLRERDQYDDESHLANIIVFQKRLMEKYSYQLIAQAKQTVLSYLFSILCISIFLMLHMFKKKGYDFIIAEFVLIPLGIDCLQTIALANIHLRLPLYKYLNSRAKDCKITIIDQVMILFFFILLSLASRLQDIESPMPYTAACSPLIILLIQRFVWYQSFLRAFKSPQHIVRYLFQLLLVNLCFNFSLRADDLLNLDVIAILWPCYGLIALTFIFFAGSFLLFISSACNQVTGGEEFESNPETGEEGSLFTCTTSTGLMLNSGYFLGFAIVGFMALLKDVKEDQVFEQGYIGVTICGGICAIFIVCQLKLLTHWYYYKLLRPQVASELLQQLKMTRLEDLDLSEMQLQSVSGGSEQNSRLDQSAGDQQQLNQSAQQNSSQVQLRRAELEALNKQAIFRRDLQEINKIELLEDAEPDVKGKILGQVPLFLVKVSKSYFQKVEHYTKQFMNRVNQYQSTQQQRDQLPQPGNLMNLAEMKGSKFAYLGARAKKKLAQKNKESLKKGKKSAQNGVECKVKSKELKFSNKKIKSQQGILSLIQKIDESHAIMESKDVNLNETDIDKLSIAEENNSDRGQKILDPQKPPQQPAQNPTIPASSEIALGTNKKGDRVEDDIAMVFDPYQKEIYYGQSHSHSEQQKKNQAFSSLKKPAHDVITPAKNSTISLDFEKEKTEAKPTSTQSELLRMCITSQLQSVQISNSIETSSDDNTFTNTEGNTERSRKEKRKLRKKTHESLYPDKSAIQEERMKKRRKSFDMMLLKDFKNNHQKTPPKKVIKENIAKLLNEINHEMGMNATEEDSEDAESIDTIKRLQNNLKQPITPGGPGAGKTKGGPSDLLEEDPMIGVKNLCMLCLERKSDAVIMDCGHSKICFFCAFKMYRTQHLCHLCRQEITKVIKIKRSHGLSYQKVIGILQMFEGKFYYSDVNQDLVKELKLYHKLNNPSILDEKGGLLNQQQVVGNEQQSPLGLVAPINLDDIPIDLDKSKHTTDGPQRRTTTAAAADEECGDIPSDIIDECLMDNQIQEIQKGNYALVARSGKRIFNQDIRGQLMRAGGTREVIQMRKFQDEFTIGNENDQTKQSRNRANSF